MKTKIRIFIESIQTTLKWLPIIWRDRQWDSYFIESMLLHKLKLMKSYHEKRQWFVGWENEVKWMSICIKLLESLDKDKYWQDEYKFKMPNKRGFSEKISTCSEYIDSCYKKKWKYSGADLWEDKTRTLFWKVFVWRYERWWD